MHRYAWAIYDAISATHRDAEWNRRTLTALHIAVGKHESHFDELVCEDFDKPPGEAVGCWQSHEEDRSGSVEGAALRAARHLIKAGRYCDWSLHGAVALYATGKSCVWSGAESRLESFRAIYQRLPDYEEGQR